MKLVKFTSLKDTPIWINPDAIVLVRYPIREEAPANAIIELISGMECDVKDEFDLVVQVLLYGAATN